MTTPHSPDDALQARYATYADELNAINSALAKAVNLDGSVETIWIYDLGVRIHRQDIPWIVRVYEEKGWMVGAAYDDDQKPVCLNFQRREN